MSREPGIPGVHAREDVNDLELPDPHVDCDCPICCPPCYAAGCISYDVTKATVLAPVTHDVLFRVNVMLCDDHLQFADSVGVWM